ncbi:flavodoxin family protein [Pectinatus cerevisiiphilus]|uniref:Flavodoxin n=1 Tax=Pectinatus cerevisiiphilus TaxID=86956 RepID=A0A4R3K9G8_9FIRM|nr:flavodoxin family protein [Pectinatus cerevisiiphilus]TCS79607.1 flavodoxin [Pectinatus cerevisiiphilus]
MNFVVVYSSRTGNTKMVAEAVTSVLPKGTTCLPVTEVKPEMIQAADCVFVGYWVDRGLPDQAAKNFLAQLTNQHIALFATLGADPHSQHAIDSLVKGAQCLQNPESVVNQFICQGKIDPKLIEQMYKMFPAGHPHGRTPERDALHVEAAKHPNEADLEAARNFARETLRRLGTV